MLFDIINLIKLKMQYNQLNNENIENIQQRNKTQNNESESSFIPSAMASSVGNFVMNCFL